MSLRTVAKTGLQRKRFAEDADAATNIPAAKRPRASVGQPSKTAPAPKTAALEAEVRKTLALERVQELETTLSDQCITALVELFHADITMADTYLALSRDGVRKQWISNRLKQVQGKEQELM